jgi:PPOX class probable F420-dependent enzyme
VDEQRAHHPTALAALVPEPFVHLLHRSQIATLTTLDPDGSPQSTAVWYLLDGDGALKTSLTSQRQKYRNLVRDPRCSLLIIDEHNNSLSLEIRGLAELARDLDRSVITRIARAYGSDPAWMDGDRYVLTYRPSRVRATRA